MPSNVSPGQGSQILFIHGTEDGFVPFEMSGALYDACNSKEYLAVEGAAHVKSAMVGGPAYWDKIIPVHQSIYL